MKRIFASLSLLLICCFAFGQLNDLNEQPVKKSGTLVAHVVNDYSPIFSCTKKYEISNVSSQGFQVALVTKNFKSEARAYCSTCGGVNWSKTKINIERDKRGESTYFTKAYGEIWCNN